MAVPYHAPCQQRGHGIGTPALDLMALVPGLTATQVTRPAAASPAPTASSARSTTSPWPSAAPLFEQVRDSGAELAVCDSETCRWQITHATGVPSVHPVEMLHRAYGLG